MDKPTKEKIARPTKYIYATNPFTGKKQLLRWYQHCETISIKAIGKVKHGKTH